MLVIRMTRVGKKKQPSYRLVVQEKGRDPWGKYLDRVGHVNPLTNPAKVALDKERITHWISKGAQPSDTVWNLLVDEKMVQGEKRRKVTLTKRRREGIAAAKAAAAPKEEPKQEEPKQEEPKAEAAA